MSTKRARSSIKREDSAANTANSDDEDSLDFIDERSAKRHAHDPGVECIDLTTD